MLLRQATTKSVKSLLIKKVSLMNHQNTINMITKTFILFFALFSCQQSKEKSNLADTPKTTKTITMESSSPFVGNYSGRQNQKEIFVSLSEVPNTNKITGFLIMDGKQAQIATTETNAICTGIITEDDTRKKYKIVLKIIDNKLHIDMVLPEYSNQVLALVLERSTLTLNSDDGNITIENEGGRVIISGSNSGSSTKTLNRDRTLVGKWRFTEVISSGSGEFYSSFSTDYFIRFNSNGTRSSWIGRSAGGTNVVIIEGDYGANYNELGWYTQGNNLYFTDLTTQQAEDPVTYYAEANRMMLSGGTNKRVYQRIE